MKLAFVCHGNPESGGASPLRFLEESVEKVKTIFQALNWVCCDVIELNSIAEYETILGNSVDGEEIEEFLFYYIGHGDYSQDIDYHFQLSAETTQPTLGHFIEKNKDLIPSHNNIKKAIVVDACYSGRIIDEYLKKKYNSQYELLTATSAIPTYEAETISFVQNDQNYENINISSTMFSYFFCKYAEETEENFSLGDIKYFIDRLESIKKDQDSVELKPRYHINQNKAPISLDCKDMIEIKNSLREKDFARLHLKSLEYLKHNNPNKHEILSATDIETLLPYITRDSQCLHCLCKEYAIENAYTKKLKQHECTHTENSILNHRKVHSIVVVLDREAVSKKIDYSTLLLATYFEYEGKHVELIENIQPFKGVQGQYEFENKLAEYIGNIYKTIRNRDNQIYIRFIMPEEFFEQGFHFSSLKIHTGPLGEDDILDFSNISYKFLMRYQNFSNEQYAPYNVNWENNSRNIDAYSDSNMLDCQNTNSCNTYNHSDTNILQMLGSRWTTDMINSHIKFGICMSIYDASHGLAFVSENKVDEANAIIYSHLKSDKKSQFIHDRYDDMQKIIEQKPKPQGVTP